MPRLPRKFFQTSFFHVICQGINKLFIFDTYEDIKKYKDFMYELKDEHQVKIIAYCIMNNHVHLLLEVENVACLSAYMHRLNTKYAHYYNTKYNRVGFVFRNRFKSEGIFSEKYLYNCINYIFKNPVKAGICNNPEDYPYSNYKEYIKDNGIDIEESNDEYCGFIDIAEDRASQTKKIIEQFLIEKNRSLPQVIINIEYLSELVNLLNKNKVPISTIEKEMGVNRKKLKSLLLKDI